jgi:D-amino-acid oxidase
VRLASGVTAHREARSAPPEFAADAPDLAVCAPAERPPGYQAAWRHSAPLVDMPDYLAYLHDRYVRAGGSPLRLVRYPALTDALAGAGSQVLVNCTGCGARDLVPDAEVIPVRGQVVVAANPGLEDFFVGTGPAEDDLTYYFPHRDRVVLGGTQQQGDWSRQPDPATAERILASCAAVTPALRNVAVIEHRVGLRPTRPVVRLEAVSAGDRTTVVHNYGHGGAGVTLSWGCAQDAAHLARAALP